MCSLSLVLELGSLLSAKKQAKSKMKTFNPRIRYRFYVELSIQQPTDGWAVICISCQDASQKSQHRKHFTTRYIQALKKDQMWVWKLVRVGRSNRKYLVMQSTFTFLIHSLTHMLDGWTRLIDDDSYFIAFHASPPITITFPSCLTILSLQSWMSVSSVRRRVEVRRTHNRLRKNLTLKWLVVGSYFQSK